MVRPVNVQADKDSLGQAVQGLAKGEVSDPYVYGHLHGIYVLHDIIEFDTDDFNKSKKA